MTTIRRMMLGGLAALLGGPALAQAPVPRNAPPANSQPAAKAVDIAVDPITGAIIVTQGLKAQWKPTLPAGMQLIKIEPSDATGVLIEQSLTDPNRQDITGLKIGVYKLYLTVGANQNDPKAVTREFEVLVQPNYEMLKRAIARAVPTASIEIIPATGANIIIAGYVNRPEDAETVIAIARASTITSVTTTGTTGTTTGVGAGQPAGQPAAANANGTVGTTANTAVTSTSVAVGQIINAIQVGGLQHVQIEVTFASVDRSLIRTFGTNLSITGTQGSFISNLVPAGSSNLLVGIVPSGITLALQALKNENMAKLLTEPKVVTQSGRPAIIRSGGQQAVLSATGGGLGSISVTLEEVGTTMQVLPIVYGNGKIYLEVSPRVRTVNNGLGISTSAGFSPGFSEQSVQSSVMLESGQTFAIGGLIQTTVQSTASKVPVIGEVPYVGALFRNSRYEERETELIILVTPRLVDALDCNQVPKRVPGRETRSPDDYEFYLEGLLEAPRGQRQVWNGRCYQAAYKCDPTYGIFPCKGNICGANGNCGANGADGSCAAGVPTSLPATNAPSYRTVPATAPAPLSAMPAPLPAATNTATPVAPTEAIVMPQAGTLVTPPISAPSPLATPITVPETVPGPVTPSDVPAAAPVAPVEVPAAPTPITPVEVPPAPMGN